MSKGNETVKVVIGRMSGPTTDECVEALFTRDEAQIVADTLAMVNKATGGKEGWYYQIDDEAMNIPTVK